MKISADLTILAQIFIPETNLVMMLLACTGSWSGPAGLERKKQSPLVQQKASTTIKRFVPRHESQLRRT
jgi:hypothetical protein